MKKFTSHDYKRKSENMLYLGCHLWMKLLKLSIQSIILLYQFLVREHRKKSRLRSAATRLLLGLAFSHDYVSKNSSAFTCQTLYKRCWFGFGFFSPLQPTSWEWKHQNLSVSRKNIPCSTIIHLVSLKSSRVLSMLLPLTPWCQEQGDHTNIKGSWLLSQGVSPHHGSFHSLGNGVSTFSWLAPSVSQGVRWPYISSKHHTQGLTS